MDAGFSHVASTCPGSKPAGSPTAPRQRVSTAAHLGGSCDFQGSWGFEQTAAPARDTCCLTFHSLRVSSYFFLSLGGIWRNQDLIPAQISGCTSVGIAHACRESRDMLLARLAHLLEDFERCPRQIAIGSVRASFCLRFISFPEEHRQCFPAPLQRHDNVNP